MITGRVNMTKGSVNMMDELDKALIAQLTMDARMPLSNLARKLKVARSTVQARLERLESAGIVAGYTIKLGAVARDSRIRASILLTIEPRNQPAILARLRALPEVERIHTTSGRFDLLVQVAATDTSALDGALDAIGTAPGVRSSESLIHLSTKLERG
jgi:DNA-binding Lrp family transcriptional regulator